MRWLSSLEGRASSLALEHPRDPVLSAMFGAGAATAAGISITPESAQRISAVYACVRVLAESIAAQPLVVWKRKPGGKERDPGHPLWDLLHTRPNRRQTSFEWRETMVGHTALRGDAYSEIVPRNDGTIAELLPLHPDRTRPFLAPDGRVAYAHSPLKGGQRVLLADEVLRLPSWSDDGVTSKSIVSAHRETFGHAVALQQYGSRLFGNGAAPRGGIVVPGAALDDEAAKALRESWERRHGGVENAHRVAILDGGMEWQNIGLSNEDAEYLGLRKFSVEDIARIFKVPPHKIGHLERSTNNNIEHQAIEFVVDTLVPWIVRYEQRLNEGLLSEAGRQTHFIGFELKGLMRGDSKTRAAFYKALWQMGALSQNDIRRAEDMDEIPGGDVFYVPLNMAPTSDATQILMAKGFTAPDKEGQGDDDK